MLSLMQLLLLFDPVHFGTEEITGSTQEPVLNTSAPINQTQRQLKTTETERANRKSFT